MGQHIEEEDTCLRHILIFTSVLEASLDSAGGGFELRHKSFQDYSFTYLKL